MCLKFFRFEAGCAYELCAYKKKKRVYANTTRLKKKLHNLCCYSLLIYFLEIQLVCDGRTYPLTGMQERI